jgi:hypothetical protein
MTTPSATGMLLTRRSFLGLGAGGAATLLVLGGSASLAGCGRAAAPAAAGYAMLTAGDVALFSALLPVVAGPAWPAKAQAEVVRGGALLQLDAGFSRLGPPARGEFRQLLDLLQLPLFRRLACGLRRPWEGATDEDVNAFLARWRDSRLSLFNAGYRALVGFCTTAFWAQPQVWAAANYPGPPAWALRALSVDTTP